MVEWKKPLRMLRPLTRTGTWRCVCLTLWVVTVSVALVGCAEHTSEASSERVELVLVTTGGQTGESARRIAQQFEQTHPHIDVRVVVTPGAHYYVKSLTMIAGRAQVDVLWLGQGFGMFAARGALLDLSPLIGSDPDFDLDEYFQPVVDWYRYDGALYGIPTGIDVEVVGYNREHLAQADLSEPDERWTVQDLVAAGERLTESAGPGALQARTGLGYSVLPEHYFGLRLLTPDNTAFAMNTPAGRDWLALNHHYSFDDRILAYGGDREALDRLGGFLGGRVSITPVYTWDLASLSTQMRSGWDVAPVPLGPDGQRRAWASSAGFSIAHHSEHPQAAWLLLKELVGEAFQEQGLKARVPALTALQPKFVTFDDKPANRQAFIDSLDHLEPAPRIGSLQEITAEWEYWRDLAILGQITPAKALREAERKINRILDYHRGP